MDLSPADSPSRGTVSTQPIPALFGDPFHERAESVDSSVSSTSTTTSSADVELDDVFQDVKQKVNLKDVEQNEKCKGIDEQDGKRFDDINLIAMKFEDLKHDEKKLDNAEQNAKKFELMFHIESWPKQISYNRNNSVGALSMVREEGESFRSVDTRHSTHQITPLRRRSKSKTASCVSCVLYPLKKARDMYISCCFQIAGAGDLAGLVGGGHAVGNIELFPPMREDSDDEQERKLRKRGATGRYSI